MCCSETRHQGLSIKTSAYISTQKRNGVPLTILCNASLAEDNLHDTVLGLLVFADQHSICHPLGHSLPLKQSTSYSGCLKTETPGHTEQSTHFCQCYATCKYKLWYKTKYILVCREGNLSSFLRVLKPHGVPWNQNHFCTVAAFWHKNSNCT